METNNIFNRISIKELTFDINGRKVSSIVLLDLETGEAQLRQRIRTNHQSGISFADLNPETVNLSAKEHSRVLTLLSLIVLNKDQNVDYDVFTDKSLLDNGRY